MFRLFFVATISVFGLSLLNTPVFSSENESVSPWQLEAELEVSDDGELSKLDEPLVADEAGGDEIEDTDPEFTMTESEIVSLNSEVSTEKVANKITELPPLELANGDLIGDRKEDVYDPNSIVEPDAIAAEEVVAYHKEEEKLEREWASQQKEIHGPDISKAIRVENGDKFDKYYFANGDEVIKFHRGMTEENMVKALSPILSKEIDPTDNKSK